MAALDGHVSTFSEDLRGPQTQMLTFHKLILQCRVRELGSLGAFPLLLFLCTAVLFSMGSKVVILGIDAHPRLRRSA